MAEDIIPVNQPASLEVYDRIGDPISAIKTLGGAIFKSGIFGLDKPEQGEILAMQCLTERKSPLELARTYHFIQGQLAIRSDALLAKYHQAGGSVTWIERTDEKVKAEFRKGSSSAIIVADLKEYVSNGTAVGRDGKFKDNWKRWPRRMLTARAVSEGVRLIAPECCFGVYVAEEIESKTLEVVPTTLADIIPPGKTQQAVEVLVKSGHLVIGDTLEDLSEDTVASILKKPQAFINAINKIL
jgi:hypothetical protein